MKPDINWIQIPSGYATIGSNEEDMKKASEFWKDKLLNPAYGREKKFQKWLYKEFPSYQPYINEFFISDTVVPNELYQSYCDETGQTYPESLTNPELGGGKDHPAWGMDIEGSLLVLSVAEREAPDMTFQSLLKKNGSMLPGVTREINILGEMSLIPLTVIRTNPISKKRRLSVITKRADPYLDFMIWEAMSRNGSTPNITYMKAGSRS